MKKTKKVTCRPCKEENNWEIETPSGEVLPNHYSTKKEAVKEAKKYAMEAGCELEILNKGSQNKTKQSKRN